MPRIWEQGLVATFSVPGYKDMILEHYAAFQRPGVEIEVHGVRDDAGARARAISGRAVNYAYLQHLHDHQILKNVRRAEQEGFDAVVIGAIQDPALQIAKSIVDIPVLGYGEVSMHVACLVGERFSVMAINPAIEQVLSRQIRDRGLTSRAAPTSYLECGYTDLEAAVAGEPAAFLQAFERAALTAINDHGADVLIPGQTIITELLWKAGITSVEGAVVLDPRVALLHTVDMLLDLKKAGAMISRRGFFWTTPPKELFDDVLDYYEDAE